MLNKRKIVEDFLKRYELNESEFKDLVNKYSKRIIIDIPQRKIENISRIRKNLFLDFNKVNISNHTYNYPQPDEFFNVIDHDFESVIVRISKGVYVKAWREMIYESH